MKKKWMKEILRFELYLRMLHGVDPRIPKLKVQNIYGDGNCFYRAVAHLIGRGKGYDFRALRKMTADYCEQHQREIS